jgi:hypothetical protein
MIRSSILDTLYQSTISRVSGGTALSRLPDEPIIPESSLPKTIEEFLNTYDGELGHYKLADCLLSKGISPGPWKNLVEEVAEGRKTFDAAVFENKLAEIYGIPFVPIDREVAGDVLLRDVFLPKAVKAMAIHNAYGIYVDRDLKSVVKYLRMPVVGNRWLSQLVFSGFEPVESLPLYAAFWAKALPGASELIYPAVKFWYHRKLRQVAIKFDVLKEEMGGCSSDLNGFLFYGTAPSPLVCPIALADIVTSWFDFEISDFKDFEQCDCSLVTVQPKPLPFKSIIRGDRGIVVLHNDARKCFLYCEGETAVCLPAPAGNIEFEPETWRLTGAVRMTSRAVAKLDKRG